MLSNNHDATATAHALPTSLSQLSKLPHHEEKPHEASAPASKNARQIPNEAIFNTQFTTAGRKFLTKVKKNRAMQVDRRTKGFENGLEARTMLIDSITKRHYRILIVDPEMPRREDLADSLEPFFEIFVAPGSDRALALLTMLKVDLILLRVMLGNDNAAASSPTLAFLREAKKKCRHTPVTVLVPPTKTMVLEMQKLLQRILHQEGGGMCGFFEDDVPIPQLIERLSKLLHSLVVAQSEVAQCRGIPRSAQVDEVGDEILPVQAIKKRGTTVSLVQRSATSKPDSVTYDPTRMLLELRLNQRKQCLLQRQALLETLDNHQHSVLGVDLTLATSPSTGHIALAASPAPSLRRSASSPGRGAFYPVHDDSKRSNDASFSSASSLAKKIPPLPSQKEIRDRIYAKPHEIQHRIHKHLYESYQSNATKHDARPQDPLLHHCIAIDPQTISKSIGGKSLLVSKAFLLYREQRYDDALMQANRAIKLQGNNNLVKVAFLLRGVLYDISGKYTQAEQEFQRCLMLDPMLHQAHFNLSVSLLKLGRDDEALQEITLALQGDPTNAQYVRNRALMYRRMGQFALAQSEYAKLDAFHVGAAAAHASTGCPSNVDTNVPPASTSSSGSPSRVHGGGTLANALNTIEMEDGLFDHLFGKPTEDRLALVCPPKERTPQMLAAIVARLQTVLVFQDFPLHVLRNVAAHIEYEVVACGKCFTLSEDHPQNFYIVLDGKLSVRRKFGEFASSVTTHHMDTGMTFGCTGHVVPMHSQLVADESTERKRFRKGETILAQNEVPKYLSILWKGTCLMYQDFKKPPLCASDDSDEYTDEEERMAPSKEGPDHHVLPFHRFIAKPEWPLGFESHAQKVKKTRNHARGGRRNALLCGGDNNAQGNEAVASVLHWNQMMKTRQPPRFPETLKPEDKHALIHTLVAPAIFGESMFLNQEHQRSKCSIVADCIVEVLLFDHLRLQEMDLASEVIHEISSYAPKYLNEKQVAKQNVEKESWSDYKNMRLLEVSKSRWPEAKNVERLVHRGK
uniref:Cyclic nucleotide-binding domain-containing protein n=1 Tax=Globisporangium ultimum (strain ATCC 200006 / CBS 805.95 / DAOM BR144) TaxID=431595 RepID=K3WRL4_GLOUD